MRPTRRRFLTQLAAATAGGLVGPARLLGQLAAPRPGARQRAGALVQGTEPTDRPRSRLLTVLHATVVKGPHVSQKALNLMLRVGLPRFCEAEDEAGAWRKIVRPGEKVLIKFNRSAAAGLATTDAMIEALLGSLAAADVKADRIMLADVSPRQQRAAKTVPVPIGYQDAPVRVLGRDEHLARALAWADCLINVPFLKDHHLTGVTCGMKNLSHGLIKSPANWHDDRCRLAVPHLFATPGIRNKLRLTICNALRIVIAGGPAASADHIVEHNRLFFANDLVALDAFGGKVIDQARGARGLRDLAEDSRPPTFLAAARELGLGNDDLDRVDVSEMEA